MFARQRIAFTGWVLVAAGIGGIATTDSDASDNKVIFDIPSKIECRDVTPEKCAKAHPTMKVIEARFRISAGVVEGDESSIEDFVYLISSPGLRLKVLDFLPNTTLESTAAGDRIEVTDNTESTDVVSGEAKVAYSLISLNASKTSASRKLESNRYERVAPKNLVLASGTANRGYGVFYKLRPSSGVSLEGDKEFVVLCIVPKTWRGDWCSVTCSARSRKKSSGSARAVQSGIEQAHVGLFLSGCQDASELADDLTRIQLANEGLLAKHLATEATHSMELLHETPSGQLLKISTPGWLKRTSKIKPSPKELSLEAAKTKLIDIQEQLERLSGSADHPH